LRRFRDEPLRAVFRRQRLRRSEPLRRPPPAGVPGAVLRALWSPRRGDSSPRRGPCSVPSPAVRSLERAGGSPPDLFPSIGAHRALSVPNVMLFGGLGAFVSADPADRPRLCQPGVKAL